MKTISIFKNTPTVVHVSVLPPLQNLSFDFGFNPGQHGVNPTIRINVSLLVTQVNSSPIKICTYDCVYEIVGEGLIIEDHIYGCCIQTINAMKMFLQFDALGRSIPQELMVIPMRESFEDDLAHLAKVLNAFEGKRGLPPEKP